MVNIPKRIHLFHHRIIHFLAIDVCIVNLKIPLIVICTNDFVFIGKSIMNILLDKKNSINSGKSICAYPVNKIYIFSLQLSDTVFTNLPGDIMQFMDHIKSCKSIHHMNLFYLYSVYLNL